MRIPMHPAYGGQSLEWDKWRATYKGGPNFIDKYLLNYSTREDSADFAARKSITYNPTDAKAAVEDVRNSLYQHLIYVTRTGGPLSYQRACSGEDGGVDRTGIDMRNFIGCHVLPEMLLMRKVGVFVDSPEVIAPTRAGLSPLDRPYAYIYEAEKILNWAIDEKNPRIFTSLLLTDFAITYDSDFYLPRENSSKLYRYFRKENGKVRYIVATGIDDDSPPIENKLLDIKEIPFTVFEISSSLMVDICDHQIALLNLESSDVNFCWKANFPIYTESFDPRFESPHLGDAATDVGVLTGIRYPTNHQPPAFISPPSEPLMASMAKGEKIKAAIRNALNLTIANLSAPGQASAPAKKMDMQGLTSGLSYIGMALQQGESQLAAHWAAYEKTDPARVDYPVNYQIKSDAERFEEVQTLNSLAKAVPSQTWRKEMNKKIIFSMFSGRIGSEVLNKMLDDVEKAELQILDRDVIQQDLENGLVTREYVSVGVGYPEDQAKKAKLEHMERVAAIAATQTKGVGPHVNLQAPASRGANDLSADPKEGSTEKQAAGLADLQDTPSDVTRGEGNE